MDLRCDLKKLVFVLNYIQKEVNQNCLIKLVHFGNQVFSSGLIEFSRKVNYLADF